MKKYLLVVLTLLCCQFANATLQRENNQAQNQTTLVFKDRMQIIGNQFFDIKGLNVNDTELQALQFLYAYMPVADVTDYPTAFYLDNIRTTFQIKNEIPWGATVPDLLFRHFVLPLRVNNENLDNSRKIFYQALKDRIKGMSMQEAILEVNH